ncbi:hypothetical protein BD310DRAFT_681349 [Dichomitus squalens]|uniref:Uncharacterized protein n=1 Tax=Dichomitus squalens TaxID=114155 RepID=A0A4Q9PMN6_9APHY|nr:hypothetical protein BD310DRAFT_681349 [Dichomitus squalens]
MLSWAPSIFVLSTCVRRRIRQNPGASTRAQTCLNGAVITSEQQRHDTTFRRACDALLANWTCSKSCWPGRPKSTVWSAANHHGVGESSIHRSVSRRSALGHAQCRHLDNPRFFLQVCGSDVTRQIRCSSNKYPAQRRDHVILCASAWFHTDGGPPSSAGSRRGLVGLPRRHVANT